MTSRLIIDDIRTFSKLGTTDVVYARTCAEGIDLIRSKVWNEIWLDWDLSGTDTAIDAVKLLEALGNENKHGAHKIVVCSANSVGRQYIHLALDKYYDVLDIWPGDYI